VAAAGVVEAEAGAEEEAAVAVAVAVAEAEVVAQEGAVARAAEPGPAARWA
jgi:hypothetical protein